MAQVQIGSQELQNGVSDLDAPTMISILQRLAAAINSISSDQMGADSVPLTAIPDGLLTAAKFATGVLQTVPSGTVAHTASPKAPDGWLVRNGANVSRTTYANLFEAINPDMGDPTISIATPGVFVLNDHGMVTGSPFFLETTGALPTGLSTATIYYCIKYDANTFWAATSRANAFAGTKIATSGSQSGTHTLRQSPWGLGDGASTFTLPNGVDMYDKGASLIGSASGDAGTYLMSSANVTGHTTCGIPHGAGTDWAGSFALYAGVDKTITVPNYPYLPIIKI